MVSSLFYDYLAESIDRIVTVKPDLKPIRDYQVHGHNEFTVDYAFLGNREKRPIYLFGVKGTDKAQQTAINCLTMRVERIPHKSIAVFENIDEVTNFARDSLINACGKVFSNLDAFKTIGLEYIEQELIAG